MDRPLPVAAEFADGGACAHGAVERGSRCAPRGSDREVSRYERVTGTYGVDG